MSEKGVMNERKPSVFVPKNKCDNCNRMNHPLKLCKCHQVLTVMFNANDYIGHSTNFPVHLWEKDSSELLVDTMYYYN